METSFWILGNINGGKDTFTGYLNERYKDMLKRRADKDSIHYKSEYWENMCSHLTLLELALISQMGKDGYNEENAFYGYNLYDMVLTELNKLPTEKALQLRVFDTVHYDFFEIDGINSEEERLTRNSIMFMLYEMQAVFIVMWRQWAAGGIEFQLNFITEDEEHKIMIDSLRKIF